MALLADDLEQLGADGGLVRYALGTDDVAELWARCPRADWLLFLAARVGIDRRAVVRAVHASASVALRFVPPGEPRPAQALRVAARWANGDARGAEAWAAAFHATESACSLGTAEAISAARAAACVAFACDAEADDVYYASRGHVTEVVEHVVRAYAGTRTNVHAVCAELVRAAIDGSAVAARIRPAALRATLPAFDAPSPTRAIAVAFAFDTGSR